MALARRLASVLLGQSTVTKSSWLSREGVPVDFFASWVALLEWMDAGSFVVEPWGIKLGAALYLNELRGEA